MALKRSMLIGVVIGALLGFFTFGILVTPYILSHTLQNPQPCDLFVVSKQRPDLSGLNVQLCWYEVNFPVENNDLYIFVCPTPYTLSAQGYFGELNEEVITQFYDSCQQLQSYNPFEQNVEEVDAT